MALILVVDDEEYIRTLSKELLEAYGHVVTTTDSGKEALKLCQERSFDLLITDVQMPTMTGFELIGALKEARINVPILVISGTHGGQSLQTASSLGAIGALTKPVSRRNRKLEPNPNQECHDVSPCETTQATVCMASC